MAMGRQWWCAYLQMTVFTKSEKKLERVVDEFYSLCTKRKLKVNAEKSIVIVFVRGK